MAEEKNSSFSKYQYREERTVNKRKEISTKSIITDSKTLEAAKTQIAKNGEEQRLNDRIEALNKAHEKDVENLKKKNLTAEQYEQALFSLQRKHSLDISSLEAKRKTAQIKDEQSIAKIAELATKKKYENGNVRMRAAYAAELAENKKLELEQKQQQDAALEAAYALETNAAKKASITKQRKKLASEITELAKDEADLQQEADEAAERALTVRLNKIREFGTDNGNYLQQELNALEEQSKLLENKKKQLLDEQLTIILDGENLQSQLSEALKNGDTALAAELTAAINENNTKLSDNSDKLNEVASATEKNSSETKDAQHKQKMQQIANRNTEQEVADKANEREENLLNKAKDVERDNQYAMSKEGLKESRDAAMQQALDALVDSLSQIDSAIDSFYQYQAKVEARLQGTDESYKSMLQLVSTNIAVSPLIKQADVLKNISEAAEAGIGYNIELRAFLQTVSENIATTFDAFNSNLTRLIRVQQADTTAARLGMEASLTKLFNQYFSDTSYLSDVADSISGAILEANAQLTRDQSMEFEFIVQKWLGSLYSVGVSDAAVNTIAQGLTHLATGNVDALNSNDSLNSLLAMSASRAGISYADILTGGLDAKTTNDLLKSMVEYLAGIYNNTDNNQVTKAAYANIFGITSTDILSMANLSNTDIENIHKQTLGYNDAMSELNTQLNEFGDRIHISQKVNTLFDNLTATSAGAIGSNFVTYGLWKVLNLIDAAADGINIPSVSAAGFGIDLEASVVDLARLGMAGLGLMGGLISGMAGGGSIGGYRDLENWGYDQYTARGTAVTRISKGTASGVSESSSLGGVGSASGKDVKQTSMQDAADQAEEDSKTTNQHVEEESDIYNKIYAAIAKDESTTILTEVQSMNNSLSKSLGEIIGLLDIDRIFKSDASTAMSGMQALLDPGRVFFTATVATIPTSANSFEMDNSTGVVLFNGNIASSDTVNYAKISSLAMESRKIAGAISNTSAEISVANAQLANNTVNGGSSSSSETSNTEAVKVSISEMSPAAQTSFETMMQTAISNVMNGTEEDPSSNLIGKLKDALDGLRIIIGNDNIEEVLQRLMST